MSTKEQGVACYDKAEPTEPLFVLRGQDYSSPAVVDFWVLGNLFLRQRLAEGMKPEVAVIELRAKLRQVFDDGILAKLDAGDPLIWKFGGAFVEAERLDRWPVKKLAD